MEVDDEGGETKLPARAENSSFSLKLVQTRWEVIVRAPDEHSYHVRRLQAWCIYMQGWGLRAAAEGGQWALGAVDLEMEPEGHRWG